MTHHNESLYDPTKSVLGFKKSVVETRCKELIDIIRANGIYRDITIPDFLFIRNQYYNLIIIYPEHFYNQSFMLVDKQHKALFIPSELTDEEFVKFVDAIDELVNGDIDDYLDELYYEVDDEERINKLKEQINHEDPLA